MATGDHPRRTAQSIAVLGVTLVVASGGSCLHSERPYVTHAQAVVQALLRRGRAVQTLRRNMTGSSKVEKAYGREG